MMPYHTSKKGKKKIGSKKTRKMKMKRKVKRKK